MWKWNVEKWNIELWKYENGNMTYWVTEKWNDEILKNEMLIHWPIEKWKVGKYRNFSHKNIESNYNNEEELLVEVNQDIRDLITELEKKDNVKKTQQET